MVRDFFSKLLRREISSFVRISVTVAPLPGPPQTVAFLTGFQAGEGHDDTPRIGTMKSAPQCGWAKSRSTTVRNYTLLCICKSSDRQLTRRYVAGGPHCWAMRLGLTERRSGSGTDQAAGC